MNSEEVLEIISQLTSSSVEPREQSINDTPGGNQLDTLLLKNIESTSKAVFENEKYKSLRDIFAKYPASNHRDIQWTFVGINLDLLLTLRNVITSAVQRFKESSQGVAKPGQAGKDSAAPPLSPDTLSFSQQKTLSSCVQFVVTLGLCPYLQPGVGIPLQRRSGFAEMIRNPDQIELDPSECIVRLKRVCDSLLKCVPQATIGSAILSRHLGDLLGTLIQISYQPPSAKDKGESDENKTNQKHVPNRSYFREQLDKLTGHVFQPVLIREILVLQSSGSGPPHPKRDSSTRPARAPVWLRAACGKLLSERLMQPKGVQNVLRGILDIGVTAPPSQAAAAADWRKCDAAAKIIATCPKDYLFETYYKCIGPQLLELFQVDDKLTGGQFARVASTAIALMMSQQPDVTEKYVLKPILLPLYACSEDCFFEKPDGNPIVVVKEESLTSCIDTIHKITVKAAGPDSSITDCLGPLVHTLFSLQCTMSSSVSHLKTVVDEILTVFISKQDLPVSMAYIQLLIGGHVSSLPSDFRGTKIHPYITFIPGSRGGMVAINAGFSEVDVEPRAKKIVELLKNVNNDDLSAEFFIIMLKELARIVSKEIEDPQIEQKMPSAPNTLEFHDPADVALEKIMQNLLVLTIISEMTENLGHSCFKKKEHIIDFIQLTLERAVKVLQNTDDELLSASESEQLSMSMGLLSAILREPKEIGASDREKVQTLLPYLHEIEENHTSAEIRKTALDLRVAVATHGIVRMDRANAPQRLNASVKEAQEKYTSAKRSTKKADKPIIEEIKPEKTHDSTVTSEMENPDEYSASLQTNTSSRQPASSSNLKEGVQQGTADDTDEVPSDAVKAPDLAYEKAMEELMDPLVPVRGHALITLRKLVELKHASVAGKHETLMHVFKENLQHDDTYIYLAAVQGLIATADTCTDTALPLLVAIYGDSDREKQRKISPEARMKVGEVLMRVARNSGDMVPKYKDLFLNGILKAAQDQDPLVRASGLSNLGEVCKMLQFSLGTVVHEVVACISFVVKSDPDVNCRKAAAMVITLVLHGLGNKSIQILGSGLRDLYHLLKHLAMTEKDDTVMLHVGMALEELDLIMKAFIFPKQELSKKIHVLDAPERFDFK